MPKTASEPAVQNAGRLKYADPRDLPSYPSTGLSSDGAAASAAASLGWANKKSPEPWRPDKSSSASAAAVLAKDYKPSSTWEPSSTNAGAKAALLAVGSAGAALKKANSEKKTPQHENWGNSAANQAFHANRPPSAEPANLEPGSSAATQAFHSNAGPSRQPQQSSPSKPAGDRSLAAAKGAMSSSRQDTSRPLSFNAKETHSLEASAASSALNGATLAHRNSLMASKPAVEDVGAVPVTTMTRNMFTSHPPVKPEQDEERLHQTAVELAKKMYQQQQKAMEQHKDNDKDSTTSAPYAGTYLNLQDAAYKQAQERLAKLHDEHQQSREFQEYYGNTTTSPRRKFSVTNKLRRRSASDPDPDDRVRSEKIREQMSMFSNKLSEVDKGKRTKDREALLAAAQRNVKARLQGMDEKVFQETGKRNSTMLTDFELKAQQAAQSRHDSRSENKGKIDIGGGKFMTQDEINAIASKRLQPVLDDINEKAEAERERLATLKMEEEARREELARQKAREREEKELARKIKDEEKQEERAKKAQEKAEEKTRKDEEKAKKAQQKQEEKARKDEAKAAKAEEQRKLKEEQKAAKDEEKAAKAEEERQAKEEKRRSKMEAAAATTAGDSATTEEAGDDEPTAADRTSESNDDSDDDSDDLLDTDDENENENEDKETEQQAERERESQDVAATSATGDGQTENSEMSQRKSVEGSASSSKSKPGVKGWIKNRFSRGKSVSEKPEKESGEKRRSFFGGASMKGNKSNKSNTSLEKRSSSIRDVAMAGKSENEDDASEKDVVTKDKEVDDEKSKDKEEEEEKPDSRGVSPVSTPAADDKSERESRGLEPPKPLDESLARTSSSPTRDSRFKEEIQ
ncbi:Eisosome assembly protein [Lecanicillium sp. MT-2017a]|nr:Eisosome assembly protein [Lecanicillium sp. MT-2017a]